jgi:hypothetical protein
MTPVVAFTIAVAAAPSADVAPSEEWVEEERLELENVRCRLAERGRLRDRMDGAVFFPLMGLSGEEGKMGGDKGEDLNRGLVASGSTTDFLIRSPLFRITSLTLALRGSK